MKVVLKAKYTQSEKHKHFLIETGTDTLAEASPNKYWGTGYKLHTKEIWQPHSYKGQNRLGKLLEEVRLDIM